MVGKVNAAAKPEKGLSVILDPGHGGHDQGSSDGGVIEKDLNLVIAKGVAKKLSALGYHPILRRTDDSYMKVNEIAKWSNRNKAELFVSIHSNVASNKKAEGIEVQYAEHHVTGRKVIVPITSKKGKQIPTQVTEVTASNPSGRAFAQEMGNEIVKVTHAVNRGAKAEDDRGQQDHRKHLAVLNGNVRDRAILVEIGFLTNDAERRKLQTVSYQNKLIDGIVNGIRRQQQTNPTPTAFKGYTWDKHVNAPFLQKTEQISKHLNINPNALMATMASETNGSFDPQKTSKDGGAVGLIQFTQAGTQKLQERYPTVPLKHGQFKTMSATQQLDWVERYLKMEFEKHPQKHYRPIDVYAAVFAPAGIGKPMHHTLYDKERNPDEYKRNSGLDVDPKNGKITLGKLNNRFIAWENKYKA